LELPAVPAPKRATSSVLRSLAEESGDHIVLASLLEKDSSRAHGFALFFFALPEAVPIPIPGVSAVLAIPILLLSAHLAVFGERLGIPEKLRRKKVPVSTLRKVAAFVVPVLEKLERISRPRWEPFVRRKRLLGLTCLILAIVIVLPIPLANFLPGSCIAVIGFGLMERDGVIAAVGVAASFALVIGLYFVADFLGSVLTALSAVELARHVSFV